MPRNRRPISNGMGGRIKTESVADLERNTQLGWMIEEYKVSVFAQEIKTAFPVSAKRLEKKIHEIERMI